LLSPKRALPFVIALAKGKHAEAKMGMRALGGIKRCLINKCLLHYFNALR
jgi:hypothetical protein